MKTIFIGALVVVVLTGCAGYVPGRKASSKWGQTP